jgi:hypothetical protein
MEKSPPTNDDRNRMIFCLVVLLQGSIQCAEEQEDSELFHVISSSLPARELPTCCQQMTGWHREEKDGLFVSY